MSAPGLVLATDVQVLAGGRVLVGGDPRRLVRLHAAAPVWSPGCRTPGAHALARCLLDAKIVHAVPRPRPAEITVAVPVRDRTAAPTALVASPREQAPVVVFDDGSADRAMVEDVCVQHGARRVRLDAGCGPGAERDAGLAIVDTPFVALLDSGCAPPPGWLPTLLGHFDDPAVVAVAPRVRTRPAPGLLGRYARSRRPLDLGLRPARARPGGRVPCIPTAALLVRRNALAAAPVFDPALRYGESVALVRQMHYAGGPVRYDPSVVAEHDEPDRWRNWLLRRHRYGTSAAPLAARHRRRLAPLVVRPWSACASSCRRTSSAAAQWPSTSLVVLPPLSPPS